ncbi:hypothetical protein [Pseudomonas syringae]|nr:hypothetical protein [Pseudomonas syringae]
MAQLTHLKPLEVVRSLWQRIQILTIKKYKFLANFGGLIINAAALEHPFYYPAPVHQILVHELSGPADTPVMVALGPANVHE